MIGHLLPPTPQEIAELVELMRSINLGNDSAPTQESKPKSGRLSRRLTKEMVEDIVQRYRSGESTTKLSVKYGVSRSSVAALLRKQGVALRGQAMTQEAIDRAVALYRQGLTIRQVAERVGHSYGTVRAVLHRERVAIGRAQARLRIMH